ncbi:uncharacterized protein LOC125043372 [Penaeus chinensis]|uniref:uncharacterized protein LOC125043372 n=1 Tax=Penaeus chinensis TaxID=139456 RepID=UPI001FB65CED|nr:uncharacterized protein LOC125043372 [Penaeus chinensis]
MELSSGGGYWKNMLICGTLLVLAARGLAGPIDENDFEIGTEGKCNEGWELCPTAPDRCIPSGCMDYSRLVFPTRTCGIGMAKCLDMNICVIPCPPNSALHNPSSALMPALCVDGKMYCPSTGTCGTHEECTMGKPGETPICNFGYQYCLIMGGCVPKGGCPDDDAFMTSELTTCPYGQVYCLATGTCVEDGACGRPVGAAEGSPDLVCPPNKVFCLSSGTCKEAGACGGRPPESMATMCPRGYVYCLERGECVSAHRGCNWDSRNCPAGEVFSLKTGSCVGDNGGSIDDYDWLPDAKCPDSSRGNRAPFTHSTCFTPLHCPFNHSCCPDPEKLHLQCVTPDGVSNPQAINISCLQLESKRHNTGINCTVPEDCPVASVCCGGQCKSSRGVETCPPGTLYCNLTKKCTRLGERCARVCAAGQFYCVSTDECGPESACEFDVTGGAPWTLPGPLMLAGSGDAPPGEGVQLSEAFNFAEKGPQTVVGVTAQMQFRVVEATTTHGQWSYRRYANEAWTDVVPGEATLTPSHFLRFTPNKAAFAFGLDYLVLRDASNTKVNRTVVQLVAPDPPGFVLQQVDSSLTTPEDVHLTMMLGELVRISTEDELYWNAWNMAIELPKAASKRGLLDIGHPSVASWVTMLLRPDLHIGGMAPPGKGKAGARERGVTFALSRPNGATDSLANFAFSRDLGQTWETSNLVSSFDFALDSSETAALAVVKIIPAPNKAGNMTLHLTPYSRVIGSSEPKARTRIKSERLISGRVGEEKSNEVKISLEIKPVNDLPVPKTSADLTQVPMLDPAMPTRATTAQEYARLFFRDVDGTEMGMAIYQASGGSLGWWEYSLDGGATYIKISDLTANPLPKYLKLGTSFSGVVNFEDALKKLECDIKNALKNPTILAAMMSSGTETCLNGAENTRRKRSSVEEGRGNEDSSLSRRIARQTQGGQAVFNGFGSGSPNFTTECPTVLAYMLPGEALLRFRPMSNSTWGKADALRETRLVFGAWDQQEEQHEQPHRQTTTGQVSRMNITIPNCLWECECVRSVSSSPVVVAAEWSDCGGGAVVTGEPKLVDTCGVCGGVGLSCLDCQKVVHGKAKMECGECVGGKTGKTAKRDCAGRCGEENELRRVGQREMCLPKGQADPLPCDNQTDSGAFINACGKCVGGTTGLGADEGKDRCGACGGDDSCVGCDGVANSGAVRDLCGECLVPGDPNFNDCQAIGKVQPLMLDSAFASLLDPADRGTEEEARILQRLTLSAEITGVNTIKHKAESCTLTTAEKTISAQNIIFRDTKLKATFRRLEPGTWTFACAFRAKKSKGNKNPELIELIANDEIEVVDSTESSFDLPITGIDPSSSRSLELRVKDGVPLGGVTAFLLYQYTSDGAATRRRKRSIPPSQLSSLVVELPTEPSGESTVTATLPDDLRPGKPFLGVASTPEILEMVKIGKIDLPMQSVTITAPAPSVRSANLSADGRVLVVEFDLNVESDAECRDLIDWPWLDSSRKSPPPECRFRAATLTVHLGTGIAVEPNSSLAFRANNGIRRAFGDASTAPEASGSFVAWRFGPPARLKFQLTGDGQTCNASNVQATVSNIWGALISDVTVVWNVTWEPGRKQWSQLETLLTWESVETIKAAMVTEKTGSGETLSVTGALFRPGIEYLIVAQLETSGGVSSEAKGVTVKSMAIGEAIKVRVKGPREVYADKTYKYIASPILCSETESIEDLNLKYYWSLDVEGASLSHEEGQMATIPAGILQGGRTSILTVKVIADDPEIMGTGQAELTVLPQGIEVIVAADSLRIGATAPLTLDASGSKDLDNLPGDFNFRWSCMTATDLGCFVQVDGQLTRFETHISEADLSSSVLVVPPETLPVGKYKMTVEVWKEEVVSRRSVQVEIAAGALPDIIIEKPDSVVLADERLYVRAWVTGVADLVAWWEVVQEPGFSFVDISQLPAGAKMTLKGTSNRRPYDLVLPKERSENFVGLEDGTSYKFRLTVETPLGHYGLAEVILTTNNPPIAGSFEVTPSSGEALVTYFQFSVAGWSEVPEDLPLTTSFGYRLGASETITWAFTTTDEDPTAEIVLPGEGTTTLVTPLAKACDTNGGCTVVEGSAVTVTLADALSIEVFGALSQQFTNGLGEDDTSSAALDIGRGVVGTLDAMGSDAQKSTFTVLADLGIQEKVANLLNRNADARRDSFDMVSSILDLAEEAALNGDTINDILALTRQLIADILRTPVRLDEDLAFQSKDQLVVEAIPTDGRVYYPGTDSDLTAVRYRPNSRFSEAQALHRKNDGSGHRRLKRQAISNDTEQQPLTVEQVLTGLRVTEKAFVEADTEGTKTARMDELLKTIPGYLSGLCVGMSNQDIPKNVLGTLVGLTVVKSALVNEADTKFVIADSTVNKDDFLKNDSDITWGVLLDSYTEWSCGRKGAEGEDLACYGACLGTVQYKDDFLSPVFGVEPPGDFRGTVVQGVLMNPVTGVEIPLDNVPEKIQINMVIENYTVPEGKRLKCYAWDGEGWNGRLCGTGKMRENGEVRLQRCNCNKGYYIAVFLITSKPGQEEPSTTTMEIPTAVDITEAPGTDASEIRYKNVKFKIQGNYSVIVGDRKDEFEKNLTQQLAAQLQCTVLCIQNLTVSPGSVLVEFFLQEDGQRMGSSKSTEELYMELYAMIQNGELELKGPKSEDLFVPPQELDGTGPAVLEKKDPTLIPIIIGSVVGGLVLIVLVFICVAIYMKAKKRGDKVQSLQTLGSQPPTYSSIHFENSLDGTAMSMSKRRNNQSGSLSSGGAYSDEGIYIERRSTASGSRGGSGGSVGGSSVDSGTGGEVPEPFKYQSPTKEELERSGPIPEHIIKKIKENEEEVLPGTPAGLE